MTAATLPASVSIAAPPMDELAFRVFYAETAPVLRAYVRRASGDATLADDILQEAFFRLLRAGMPASEGAQLKAYIYRIANSLLADHWRRVKRERRWTLANWIGGEPRTSARQDGDAMNVFAQLKPQEQSLLWLAYVEGFDHREIASTLQLKEGSIRVLLFRARKRLADMLVKRRVTIEGQV